jgi:hypothetical protein
MSVDNFTQQHDLSLFKARILLFKTKIKMVFILDICNNSIEY